MSVCNFMSKLETNELLDRLNNQLLASKRINRGQDMNEQQLQGIVNAAVSAALQVQRKEFEARIEQLTNQFQSTSVTDPEIKAYEPIKIIAAAEIEAENEAGYETDALNFLAENPCSRLSSEQ